MVISSNLASTGSNLASIFVGSLDPGGTTIGGTEAGVGGNEPIEVVVIPDDEEKEDAILKPRRGAPLLSGEGSTR